LKNSFLNEEYLELAIEASVRRTYLCALEITDFVYCPVEFPKPVSLKVSEGNKLNAALQLLTELAEFKKRRVEQYGSTFYDNIIAGKITEFRMSFETMVTLTELGKMKKRCNDVRFFEVITENIWKEGKKAQKLLSYQQFLYKKKFGKQPC